MAMMIERFAFFCKAAIEFLSYIDDDFMPDIIHCNDWQTGPMCVYLKDKYSLIKDYKNIRTLYTVHNLQYQGMFPKHALSMMELDENFIFISKKRDSILSKYGRKIFL